MATFPASENNIARKEFIDQCNYCRSVGKYTA